MSSSGFPLAISTMTPKRMRPKSCWCLNFPSTVTSAFEEHPYLFPRDRRELLKEVVDAIPRLQVVQQRLHRHPGTGKNRGPRHDFGIDADHGVRGGHGRISSAILARPSAPDNVLEPRPCRAEGVPRRLCIAEGRVTRASTREFQDGSNTSVGGEDELDVGHLVAQVLPLQGPRLLVFVHFQVKGTLHNLVG